jgi:glycosyltransferase involved in cell wall biosynthesis
MSNIATLIPAYKHEHLADLFASLQSQSYKNFKVILCDDSPARLITQQFRSGKFDQLTAGMNVAIVPGGGGLWKNHQKALDTWAGSTPLVHLLMDDDVIYPNFYLEHVSQHAQRALSASVSLRWLARPDGVPFTSLPLPDFINSAEQRVVEIDATRLFQSTVEQCENWLGELSNMVFTAQAARHFPRPPKEGLSYFGLPDVGTLLGAVETGTIAVLRDHLSGFRQHAAQSTAGTQTVALKIAFLAWVAFALHARDQKRINDQAAIHAIATATQRCLHHYGRDPQLQPFFQLVVSHGTNLPAFREHFTRYWLDLLASHADTSDGAPSEAATHPPATLTGITPHIDKQTRAPNHSIVVLDDYFPNLSSGFRVAEYNALMSRFSSLDIRSTSSNFEQFHAAYAKAYPQHAHRVRRLRAEERLNCRLAYINFLNNAVQFLPLLEAQGVEFVLTLYPGGGFGIGDPQSDAKLYRVLRSPMLRCLITTQPITADYVRELSARCNCPLPPVVEIPGVVVNDLYFSETRGRHTPYFGDGKAVLDLCFVAGKYMNFGINKGYPEFIAAAHALSDLPQVRFHVVGGFTPDDIDVTRLGDRLQFHGSLDTPDLAAFFRQMDVCVSLSRPGSLHRGNFDGFPTGCAVEASLCGVAVIASDVLEQNPGYVDQESILLVSPSAATVELGVRALIANPGRIASIGEAGQRLSRKLYSAQAQMKPRFDTLQSALDLRLSPSKAA